MQYNEIINHLKLWLRNTAEVYEKVYQKHGGVTYIGYILANEWIFKLSMLIDKNFESKDDLRNTILNLHHVHYEESVRNPKNETANYIIEKIIGLPQAHIYECDEEEWSYPKHCFENAELIEYSAAECFYTDKDFSWAIYFSHEATVSFAGRIVPKIKELLKDEEAHWNRWEYDFD